MIGHSRARAMHPRFLSRMKYESVAVSENKNGTFRIRNDSNLSVMADKTHINRFVSDGVFPLASDDLVSR